MALVFRTAGAWGAGKGSNLTAAEVDTNFYGLDQRMDDLEDNPPDAISIASITADGNLLTVHLSNGDTQGPFLIPSARWRWTGPWIAETSYLVNDVFSESGNIYIVLIAHTSDVTFDPEAFDTEGFFYGLLLSKPEQPYDMAMYYGGAIVNDGSVLLRHIAVRAFQIAGNFELSKCYLGTPIAGDTLLLPIQRNDDVIGHIVFELDANLTGLVIGGQTGTFDPFTGDPIDFVAGDILTIFAPTESEDDGAAAGLAVTLAVKVVG